MPIVKDKPETIVFMRKFLLLLLSLQIITSCSQRVKSNPDAANSINDRSELSTTSIEAQKSDNNIDIRSESAQVDTCSVRLTKDSPDYVNSVEEMKSLEKQRQRLIEKINPRYSRYLGYLLWVSDYTLLQSSHNLIEAVMREERLRSY